MTSLTQKRQLGPGGPLVSPFALGAMTFGAETDETEAHEQLDHFVARGGNFIDSADAYSNGESERIIGRWLAQRAISTDMVVATKGRFNPPANTPGASRRGLVTAVDKSLENLGVERLDLYFVHGWDEVTPIEETLDTLSALVRQGKIHQIGWSNTTGWQLQRIIKTARLGGFVVPSVFQPQYNLLDRHIEWEIVPCCIEEDLALTPWSPLGGGWLTGKYSRDNAPSGSTRLGENPQRGVEAYEKRNTERTWNILATAQLIADKHGVPLAHVALAWLETRPAVSSILLGARTSEQLQSNLQATEFELSTNEVASLTESSAPGLPPYPYGMVEEYCEVPHWERLGTH